MDDTVRTALPAGSGEPSSVSRLENFSLLLESKSHTAPRSFAHDGCAEARSCAERSNEEASRHTVRSTDPPARQPCGDTFPCPERTWGSAYCPWDRREKGGTRPPAKQEVCHLGTLVVIKIFMTAKLQDCKVQQCSRAECTVSHASRRRADGVRTSEKRRRLA